MSLAQRFERRLESLVGGAFARVFKGQVEPVEIGAALQREAADKRNVMGSGQVLSPNRYRVTLAPSDHERLVPWENQLTNSLAELLQEYLDENRWDTIGDIEVYLARDEQLHTGVFGVASRMEPAAPPRRRPMDSLSLPVVPGAQPDDYAVQGAGQGAVQGAGQGAALAPPQTSFAPPGPAAPGHAAPGQQYSAYAPPPPAPYPSAPPRTPAAALVVDQSNRRFDLRPGSNVIGRGTDADFQLLDQGISRRHLDVQYDGNVATAYDLGSTNGTTVNGHEISSQLLRHGDVIRVGHTRIVFHQERV
ncbi:FhaA domain-containing protein [uncultured Jatrophihabitans sp.]|uniref:FhaA domain-containing protein n=1 Tax=uncultured Jatrophihabitans sp. TaxID=1610747 RepID=UPI0035CC1D43